MTPHIKRSAFFAMASGTLLLLASLLAVEKKRHLCVVEVRAKKTKHHHDYGTTAGAQAGASPGQKVARSVPW